MSDVRVCRRCGHRGWASRSTISQRTVEVIDDDGVVINTSEVILCGACYDDVQGAGLDRMLRELGGRA